MGTSEEEHKVVSDELKGKIVQLFKPRSGGVHAQPRREGGSVTARGVEGAVAATHSQ